MPRLLYYRADEGDDEFLVVIFDEDDTGDLEETGHELVANLEIVGDVTSLPTNRTLRPE